MKRCRLCVWQKQPGGKWALRLIHPKCPTHRRDGQAHWKATT